MSDPGQADPATALQMLEEKLGALPDRHRLAMLGLLKVAEVCWPMSCAFLVDMCKRARQHKFYNSTTWEGEPNDKYDPVLAEALYNAYRMLFVDLAGDFIGEDRAEALMKDTSRNIFVRLSALRQFACAYWWRESSSVIWVKKVQEELTFAGLFNMLGAVTSSSDEVYPPDYEDTRWLGCTGKLLAVEMLWFFASIYGAVTKPAGFTPNPVKANKHLITVVDTLIKALHLNKADVDTAAAAAVRAEAVTPTVAEVMQQLKKLEAGGVTLLECAKISETYTKPEWIATELADGFDEKNMDTKEAEEVRLQAARLMYIYDKELRPELEEWRRRATAAE